MEVLQQFMAFVAVSKIGNFTRAAEHLHMTQPAVTQQIQALEKSLGVKLLERTNRSVELNQAGKLVLNYASDIVRLYDRMQRDLLELSSGASGPLRIGASLTFGEYVLPKLLADFMRAYPRVVPSVSIRNTRDIVEQVGRGELDIGVIEGRYTSDRVRTRRLTDDTMVIVASSSHQLCQQLAAGLFHNLDATAISERLAAENWIVRESGSGTRELEEQAFQILNIEPSSVLEIGSTQSIKACVEAGLGLSVLSSVAIEKEIAIGTLAIIPHPNFPMKRPFSLVIQNASFHPGATKGFEEYLTGLFEA
jgi:LysR family transcriptional regulator, transcriptional activator of the cysJI operon